MYQYKSVINTVTYIVKHCRNDNIAYKTRGGEGHTAYPSCMYMYIYTEVLFQRGDKLSHVYKNTLDTALFLSITAEQEQLVKLFKLNIINNITNK